MRMPKLAYPLFASLALAGCGGSGTSTPVMANPAGATLSVQQMNALKTAITKGDGAGAAGAVFSLATAAVTVLIPEQSSSASPTPYELMKNSTPDGTTGTCQCTLTGCTFTNCGTSSASGSYTLNGSLSLTNNTVAFNLTANLTLMGASWEWSFSGSVTATPTQVSGELMGSAAGSLMSSAQSANLSWTVDVKFNDIGLDANGCATSGSLDASVDYHGTNSQGQSSSYAGSGSVAFGPACGQTTVVHS